MKLHIANKNYSSWSLRPWVLMRTLGLDFQESLHPFPTGGAPSGFEAFSPTGKVPCLVDGDLTVWDSLAIVEYLSERYRGVVAGMRPGPGPGRAAQRPRCTPVFRPCATCVP